MGRRGAELPIRNQAGFNRLAVAVGLTASLAIGLVIWFGSQNQPSTPDSRSDREVQLPSTGDSGPQTSSPVGSESSDAIAILPSTAKTDLRQAALLDGVHASEQEWPTEAFSESATKWLKSLAKQAPFSVAFSASLSTTPEAAASAVVLNGTLRPRQLETTSVSPKLSIHRGSLKSFSQDQQTLEVALRELFQDVRSSARCEFKIVRVTQTDSGFETLVHAEGGGQRENDWVQWTAKWQCGWTRLGALKTVELMDFEELQTADDAVWFVDDTENTLGATIAYREQLLYGMDYWVNHLEHRLFVNRLGHHGLAIADFDGNGLEDIYVCQPGGLPNRLFLHQPDDTAIDAAETAGVNVLDDTTAALAVDLDNDGDQDLALLTVSGAYIFENDGSAIFTIRTTLPNCRNTFSITAADYDRDGLLDLYIGRYWPEEQGRGAIPLPVPYYDATNGGENLLFRNDGKWTFSNVTEQVGLDVDNTRYTMAAAWEDFDNDGDQDLYVANDFGRNCLYRNDNGQFQNVANQLGVEDTAAGMSVSWADYDHDGHADLYVGNMFSSAGGRIAYQRQYAERFDPVAQKKLQRLARGNSLFRNDGKTNGSADGFSDVSVETATTMGRWAWGSLFADINNDSWDDLLVANGHVTTDDQGDL